MKWKTLMIGLMAAYLTCSPAKASETTTELVAGHKGISIDTIVQGEVAPRTNFLVRTTVDTDYEYNATLFSAIDLKPVLVGGLSAMAEFQFTDYGGVDPRAGFDYFHQGEDYMVWVLASVGYNGGANGEILGFVKYTPEIAEDVKLLMQAEDITRFGEEGHLFSLQRLRLGLEVGRVGFGAAANLSELGDELEVDYNLGGFFSTKF